MTTAAPLDRDETIPFGPVLLGQTEKTLRALLQRTLADTGLTEPLWVALRLATMVEGDLDRGGLIATVSDRAKFSDAADLVDVLTERGLVSGGKPTEAGRTLVTDMLAASDIANGSVWRDLPAADVDAATRVLNEVLRRARSLVA